ncbi:serine acetyltransferase [Xenorhabdus bovienii]|uniref:Putative colanic acid biosynthesis acetyltransferase wcaB n=1 Tax=Xenorhabdus bovienii str. oregonense TaxID=1398202 RepID=A0A077P9Z3_XENBV|nr:serine acetyltransferase [Xenorhabdus bovienii]MDE9446806.1 serine acetyltransferase [Xenorhabdus bovienii]MDE9483702.1 serine acetyltransferase [Xenorhabdus bovienii]CDH07563.1 putative colanic acid biosynthesis acetyltransferase wcaB [Xenorhabdus bovienii str. oregonense]
MDKYDYASLEHLKCCLMAEVICSDTKKFTWRRVISRAWQNPERRFYLWWRLANYLYHSNNSIKIAKYINRKLQSKYGCDIGIGARIGAGLSISHFVGLVIAYETIIGENFHIRQNTTIGIVSSSQEGLIHIGDNVTIGANTCIIGNNLYIGNNVMIGAMSFINKNIPDNCIVYTPKDNSKIKYSNAKNKFIW